MLKVASFAAGSENKSEENIDFMVLRNRALAQFNHAYPNADVRSVTEYKFKVNHHPVESDPDTWFLMSILHIIVYFADNDEYPHGKYISDCPTNAEGENGKWKM